MTSSPQRRTGPDSDPDRSPESEDLAALAPGIVAALRLKSPRVHVVIVLALCACLAVCLVATVTRLSALPLLPAAAFVVSLAATWRARTAAHDRQLLTTMIVSACGVVLGFGLLGLIQRLGL